MANFTTDRPVGHDTPLGTILQTNPLTITVSSAQAGLTRIRTFEDRLTRLENDLAAQVHLTRGLENALAAQVHLTQGLHLVCIRTFLDAHLLAHGFNNSHSRQRYIHDNLATIADIFGLTPSAALQDLFW